MPRVESGDFNLVRVLSTPPRYPGSRDDSTRGLPVVSIHYGRYFIGGGPGSGAPAGLGAFLLHTEHWDVGVNVGGDTRKPRRASDDPILRGWGDIPGTVRGGMFASYRLTKSWSLAAHASYGRLQGDVADSPVTTDKTQRVFGAFVMYGF